MSAEPDEEQLLVEAMTGDPRWVSIGDPATSTAETVVTVLEIYDTYRPPGRTPEEIHDARVAYVEQALDIVDAAWVRAVLS